MSLIVITTPEPVEGEVKIIQQMMAGGLEKLHFRRPSWNKEQCVTWLGHFSEWERKKIHSHQFQELAVKYGLGGAHFKEADCNDHLCSRVKVLQAAAPELKISLAFHHIEQIEKKWSCIDYALLSPIFDSVSKVGLTGSFDFPELRLSLEKQTKTIFALGGITEQNIAEAKDLGFAGACCLGSIWQATDPLLAFESINKEVKKAWKN